MVQTETSLIQSYLCTNLHIWSALDALGRFHLSVTVPLGITFCMKKTLSLQENYLLPITPSSIPVARLYATCIPGTKWFIAMNSIISICILMNHQVPVAQHKNGQGHSSDSTSLTDDVTKHGGEEVDRRKWSGYLQLVVIVVPTNLWIHCQAVLSWFTLKRDMPVGDNRWGGSFHLNLHSVDTPQWGLLSEKSI